MTHSQLNFLECAKSYEASALHFDELAKTKAENALDRRCLEATRNQFLAKAKHFRELAS